MRLFEIVVLAWLGGLTFGLFYLSYKIGQMTALMEKAYEFDAVTVKNIDSLTKIVNRLIEDVKLIRKFTHTHEGKPSYTFDAKEIN